MENAQLLALAQKLNIRKFIHIFDQEAFENFDLSKCSAAYRINVFHLKGKRVGHFVCLLEKNNAHYFFDSFGRAPEPYGAKWTCKYNKIELQNACTCLCGPFILFMAYHSMNLDPDRVINHYFSSSPQKLVFKWLNEIIPSDYFKLMQCRI